MKNSQYGISFQLKDMFEKLLKSSDKFSPSVTKLLQNAGLPVGNVILYQQIE